MKKNVALVINLGNNISIGFTRLSLAYIKRICWNTPLNEKIVRFFSNELTPTNILAIADLISSRALFVSTFGPEIPGEDKVLEELIPIKNVINALYK